ncbi:type I glyceraldehyde-3-phosphate dehydrogenase [Natrialbaceae archaeon A-CW3]
MSEHSFTEDPSDAEVVRIGLNGFGRIGRNVLRASFDYDGLEIVAINDVMDNDDMEYLLRYDSVHGRLENVEREGDTLSVDGNDIHLLSERDPSQLPWNDLDVDVAFEATGLFRTYDDAAQHLEAGAEKVLISAPPKGDKDVLTVVYGVNEDEYAGEDVVSNASCTTNSVAPVVKVLDEAFGIESGLLTTVHAYTGTQALIDGPQTKRRRGRAAAENIIPTSTGAAIATTEVLPQLEGKLDGMAIRVPVPNGSITDLTVDLEADVTKEDLEAAIRDAADGELAGVLGYTDEEIVSRDIVGLPFSSYVDLESTMVLEDGLVKVLTWYDNEYGFSNRMLDLALYVTSEAESEVETEEAAA